MCVITEHISKKKNTARGFKEQIFNKLAKVPQKCSEQVFFRTYLYGFSFGFLTSSKKLHIHFL